MGFGGTARVSWLLRGLDVSRCEWMFYGSHCTIPSPRGARIFFAERLANGTRIKRDC